MTLGGQHHIHVECMRCISSGLLAFVDEGRLQVAASSVGFHGMVVNIIDERRELRSGDVARFRRWPALLFDV